MNVTAAEYFFYYFTITPFIRFILILILSSNKNNQAHERRAGYLVNVGILADVTHLIALLIFNKYLVNINISGLLHFIHNFRVNWNSYSIAYLCFTIGLISIVTRFSLFYLHRDSYFYKFFATIFILELAASLLILTTSSESIFIGWELLGLSSVLLIAFYEHRITALKNSLTILVIYKISDVILYSTLIISAYYGIHFYTAITNNIAICAILLACLIKSSLFPWIWLPRAMEGPTPSSAIFYGGIATHLPMFVFLNLWSSSIQHDYILISCCIAIIAISTLITSLLSRQSPDAKNAIAYASITQLGIIYIEILLGFYTLAIIHGIANGVYKSFEFLKSPSLLYQKHYIDKYRYKITDSTGVHTERLIPIHWRNWVYKLVYNEFILPRTLMNCIRWFLGLYSSRSNIHTIRNYVYSTLVILITFQLIIYYILKIKLSIYDEYLLIISYIFNIIAMLYKYKPAHFFAALIISIAAIYTVLFDHAYFHINNIGWFYIVALIYFIFVKYYNNIKLTNTINFSSRLSKSGLYDLFILISGITIIGVPGLASFLIWEKLEILLLSKSPDLIIYSFFVLSLNTIVFFKFYYANFLGTNEVQKIYQI